MLTLERKLAVLGKPIAHSKSPAIHAAAYAALDLDWEYKKIECDQGKLKAFVDSLTSEWLGLSVTMPLKDEAHSLSDTLDIWAQKSGVVNTLLLSAGKIHGYNTDIPGLAKALKDKDVDVSNSVVLGTGATAQSAVLALSELGASEIKIFGRRFSAATELANQWNTNKTKVSGHILASIKNTLAKQKTTCVVSTLPGEAASTLEFPKNIFGAHLFDVVYDPSPSHLSEVWLQNGGAVSDGVEMLIQQALLQIRIFRFANPETQLPSEAKILAAMKKAVGIGH